MQPDEKILTACTRAAELDVGEQVQHAEPCQHSMGTCSDEADGSKKVHSLGAPRTTKTTTRITQTTKNYKADHLSRPLPSCRGMDPKLFTGLVPAGVWVTFHDTHTATLFWFCPDFGSDFGQYFRPEMQCAILLRRSNGEQRSTWPEKCMITPNPRKL